MAWLGNSPENRPDCDAGRLDKHSLVIGQVSGNFENFTLVSGVTVPPSASHTNRPITSCLILTARIVASYTMATGRRDLLAEAGGTSEPGVHDHAFTNTNRRDMRADFNDVRDHLVAEIDTLHAGQRGHRNTWIRVHV